MSMHDLTPQKDRIYAIGFKYIFCYMVLYMWPFPFYYIPFLNYLLVPLNSFLSGFVDSVAGPALFGDSYNTFNPNTGSGDTSFRYTQACIFIVVALLTGSIWIMFDRNRTSYTKLALVFDTVLRFYLASTLFTYGFIKVFPLQFLLPDTGRLAQTYGESSPMGLLWTFMGSSKLYSAFTGAGEVLAGLLLLFRRTKLLGATVAILVFMHVFVLNLSYDVPVKLFSFHLLLISIFLALPIIRVLTNKPITSSPSLSATLWPSWNPKKTRWIMIGLKCYLIFFIAVQPLLVSFQRNQELNQEAQSADKPELMGTYTVSTFIRNNETVEETSPSRWKEIKLGNHVMEIVHADGMPIQWHCVFLGRSKKMRYASKDLSTFGEFDFNREGEDLSITGRMNQDTLTIYARRTSDYNAPLLTRGFHWISEEPFNR
jgi:hypothetical protein